MTRFEAVEPEAGSGLSKGWLLSSTRLRQILGVLWLLDGLFLLSPRLLRSPRLAASILVPPISGQPSLLAGNLASIAQFTQQNSTLVEVVASIVQIELGLLLITGLWARDALAASLIWSLLTWYVGEGLGGLLTGQASILSGSPGPVILYAILTLVVFQRVNADTDNPLSKRRIREEKWAIAWAFALGVFFVWCIGEVIKRVLLGQNNAMIAVPGAVMLFGVTGSVLCPQWIVARFRSTTILGRVQLRYVLGTFWIFAAVLQLQPYWWQAHQIGRLLRGQTGLGGFNTIFFDPLLRGIAQIATVSEVGANVSLICICLLAGIGLVTVSASHPRRLLPATLVASLVIWVAAQSAGSIFSGATTDFNSGLILAVLTLACWPGNQSV